MSPAFSERALRDAEPLIAANAQKLCNKLSKAVLGSATKKGEWSKGFDLLTWVSYYGYDFISDLSFGRSFELLDHETHRYVPSTLKSASQFLYYVGYLPFAALVRPLMGTPVQGLFPGQSAKDSLKYTQLANGRLAARIEEEKTRKKGGEVGGGRKDVFHYLLNSKDPSTGRAFTVEELQADTSVLIAAGSDGVTVTVCALFFYALQHPAILKKLTAEIRTAFDGRALNEGEEPANAIKTPQLNHLPYLNACIDESLRLAPPKPGSLPRIVLSGGTEIDGEYIPAGTTVGVSHYVIHRNADIFDSPSEFRPERWILGNEKEGYVSQEQLANQKSAFCPFGIGPMNCIGKNMAYLAIRLAVVHLLMRFDFRVDGELGLVGGGNREDVEVGRRDEGEYQLWDWIIGFPRGPRVQVRLR
jgi:cytochrome P450